MRKYFTAFLLVLTVFLALTISEATVCNVNSVHANEPRISKPEIQEDFIRTEGTKFTDGTGKEFIIKGMGFYNGNPASVPKTGGFNEETYKNLSSIGFNAVRFYFGANTFENISEGAVTYKADAFDWIDRHIVWAKNNNMRIILNMHHSPGATTIGAPGLFTDTEYQNRFVALWKEIARRYAHEPTILGYDIINEPNCKILPGDTPDNGFAETFNLYQILMQRTIDAIREMDTNHVVIVERLWISGVNERALGKPANGYYNSVPNDQRDTWQNANGKYNFPDLIDTNYAYTYHVYEPGRYAHQYTGSGGFDDDGSGGPNRVYPSDTVAKWNENDPKTGKSWTMNRDFLEYSYTVPLAYIREVKKVPAFVGELGIHVSNFENNTSGINKGGKQWILDVIDILDKNALSFSYHCYRIDEFHPRFHEKFESALRQAFGTPSASALLSEEITHTH